MRKNIGFSLLLATAVIFSACQDKPAKKATEQQMSNIAYEGKVVSTMDVGNYTYVELENNGQKSWAAGPVTSVKPGDMIVLGDGAIMTDFHSKGLDRTFKSILFTGKIRVEGSTAGSAAESSHAGTPDAPHANLDAPKKGSVEKAKGGYTVEELYAKKADLSGKAIEVRGKVMKANANIMGTNWYHLQDGTGEGATSDLMVTSQDQAVVGDIVVVKGNLILDKDFGAGYKYDVIIDGAELKAE